MANGLDELIGQLGGAPPPAGGPPGAVPGQAPYDPSAADPMEQAVWAAFPATDPNAVHELVSPAMGDPRALPQIMAALEQMQGVDRQKLDAMHQEQVNAILSQLATPEGEGVPEAAQPAPVVGGEGIGY